MLPACGPGGHQVRGWLAQLGAWVVGRPTLHGGPVWLYPLRATLCYISIITIVPCVCALVLSENFLKYMEAFKPFFAAGLKNVEEYQV